MKRRYFLGLTLAALTVPTVASTARSVYSHFSAHLRPRYLQLRHVRTQETLTVCYRIGDYYQRRALQQLSYLMRDFRTGDSTAIDPRLFDLLFDLQTALSPRLVRFDIVGGYRSPRTNRQLRQTSSGVARHSLHMSGQAVDMRVAGVSLRRVRAAALVLGRGGVGYYPGSNFVHVDTGSPRSWRA